MKMPCFSPSRCSRKCHSPFRRLLRRVPKLLLRLRYNAAGYFFLHRALHRPNSWNPTGQINRTLPAKLPESQEAIFSNPKGRMARAQGVKINFSEPIPPKQNTRAPRGKLREPQGVNYSSPKGQIIRTLPTRGNRS